MTRRILYLAPIVLLIAGAAVQYSGSRRSQPSDAPHPAANSRIAAPGRVEPISEEIQVSPETAGRLIEMRVDEGNKVRKGDVLAVIENSDYRARVAAAEASRAQRRADLDRLENGARPQELEQAVLAVNSAKTVMDNARSEMEHRRTLVARGAVSQEEFDRSEREYRVADSRYRDAVEQDRLVREGARQEDRNRARAEVRSAEAQLDEARSILDKTIIRAPITGVVLRRHSRAGESVGPQAPVFTLADTSVLRVRAVVDEVDVAHLALGQPAFVKADAFGATTFPGTVVQIGNLLGKKNIQTDLPKEKLDNKILEVLIKLDNGHELPIGLRVDAFIETGSQE
jgi:ABC exporter DevB family membrane fusion protein